MNTKLGAYHCNPKRIGLYLLEMVRNVWRRKINY